MHGRLRTLLLTLLAGLAGLTGYATPASARSSLVEVSRVPGGLEPQVLERLGLDVTHQVTRDAVRVILHTDADRRRLAAVYPSTEVVDDLEAQLRATLAGDERAARAAGDSGLPSGRQTYRVYDDYLTDLAAVAAAHPDIARPVMLPVKTVEGRDIVGVEMSSNVAAADDGKPVFLLFGAHHSREWPSAEAAMEFAIEVAAKATTPRYAAMLRRARLIVVPIVNVDSFIVSRGALPETGNPATCETGLVVCALRRKNCQANTAEEVPLPCEQRTGVDLNRNYGAYWGSDGGSSPAITADDYRGPSPFSEPETQAVRELSRVRQVTHVMSLHNIVGQVLRQPGFESFDGKVPDEPAMKALGDRMGESTGYPSLKGYDLYDVNGATEDWNYFAQGAFGYTIELGPPEGKGGEIPGSFQGPYQTHVIDQYIGGPSGGPDGRGLSEALLIAAEQAGEVGDHAILTGNAPAGATLRLHKEFDTPVCADNTCATSKVGPLPKDVLDTTTVVPSTGRFGWHVNPSTRPAVKYAGETETWTLTCEMPAGTAVATKQILVGRGQVVELDPCEGGAAPAATVNDRPLAQTGAASGIGATAATVGGLVNPLGRGASYRFDHGTTTAYGTSSALTAVTDDAAAASAAVSRSLTGLAPGTTYHYRVVAQRGDGTVVDGGDRTFTTAAADAPAPDESETQTTSTPSSTPPATAGPTATGLSVPPPASAAPLRLSAAVDRQLLRSVLGARGLLVRARCTSRCALRVTVTVSSADARRLGLSRRGIVSASRAATGERVVLGLRPPSGVRRRLARARGLAVTITVTARDEAGRTVTRVLRTRLT